MMPKFLITPMNVDDLGRMMILKIVIYSQNGDSKCGHMSYTARYFMKYMLFIGVQEKEVLAVNEIHKF